MSRTPGTGTKANARRYRRYRIGMPVELLIGKSKLVVKTADVGMSGVFVRTDVRPKDGEFVRLVVDLPFGGGPLALLGRVTSVRDASDSKRPSGVGVAFYGNGPTERDAWQAFVREIERRHPESADKDVVLGGPQSLAETRSPAADQWPMDRPPALPRRKPRARAEVETELDVDVEVQVEAPAETDEAKANAERRRFHRFEVVVEVKAFFDSIEDLVSMHTRDLSQGGMFIATSILTAEGERLTFRVVHPKTKDEFAIPCIVRRCVNDGEQRGLAVEFQLDEAGRNSFWTFIGGVVVARAEPRGRSVNYF